MNLLILLCVLLTEFLVLSRHIQTQTQTETLQDGLSPSDAIRSILNAEADARLEPVDPVEEQEPEFAGAQAQETARASDTGMIMPPQLSQKFKKGWAPTEILWSSSDMSNGYNGNIRRADFRSVSDPERG